MLTVTGENSTHCSALHFPDHRTSATVLKKIVSGYDNSFVFVNQFAMHCTVAAVTVNAWQIGSPKQQMNTCIVFASVLVHLHDARK